MAIGKIRPVRMHKTSFDSFGSKPNGLGSIIGISGGSVKIGPRWWDRVPDAKIEKILKIETNVLRLMRDRETISTKRNYAAAKSKPTFEENWERHELPYRMVTTIDLGTAENRLKNEPYSALVFDILKRAAHWAEQARGSGQDDILRLDVLYKIQDILQEELAKILDEGPGR